jgi:hypothetical protein
MEKGMLGNTDLQVSRPGARLSEIGCKLMLADVAGAAWGLIKEIRW